MLVQMCPLLPTRHRHPVTYRVLIYWEFRRAVALLQCCTALDTVSHPIATCFFNIFFAIANLVFPSTMQGCGCVLAALQGWEWEIMASCGQITVTFYSAMQEGVGRQVELVYISLGSDLVVAPGLNAWGSTWAYCLVQPTTWHTWLDPQSCVRSGQSWRSEHDSNTNHVPSLSQLSVPCRKYVSLPTAAWFEEPGTMQAWTQLGICGFHHSLSPIQREEIMPAS